MALGCQPDGESEDKMEEPASSACFWKVGPGEAGFSCSVAAAWTLQISVA